MHTGLSVMIFAFSLVAGFLGALLGLGGGIIIIPALKGLFIHCHYINRPLCPYHKLYTRQSFVAFNDNYANLSTLKSWQQARE
ncbi:hypothetical protein [Paradesulfitobacterium ferrireducens]|uniref:hypothetical protein n=1 Tax=Paradesulfitobacterium ferrireducens TaxID=2816476 RepID=UPI001F2967D6|nr:hypothetical protein [Paradesulfitobacterium ferrireducens]